MLGVSQPQSSMISFSERTCWRIIRAALRRGSWKRSPGNPAFRSPLKVVAIPAQAESRGGHQEQAENHEILKRVDHPRPSESTRVEHALAPDEASKTGHDDARRSRRVTKPVAKTKEGRCHPEGLRAAHHRHEAAEENGAESKLLLGGVEDGEPECQRQSPYCALEQVEIRSDGGHELQHQRTRE